MANEKILQVVDLCKSFHKLDVLKHISVDFEKNEVVSIIGPSGGGKSTFLRCLNLLETPTSGQILFDGVDICAKGQSKHIDQHRQKMGMVFQQFNLFPHMSIMKNLTIAPMKLQGVSQKDAEAEAMRLLERVGLADRANAYPNQLSGGQKQRSSIARALMKNAPILILDDALSAVDTDTEEHILTNLKKNREGKTTILIAHRISTIQNADIIMVLEDGTAAEIGNHDSLMAKHGIYYDMFEKQQLEAIHGEAGKALIRQNYPAAKTGKEDA